MPNEDTLAAAMMMANSTGKSAGSAAWDAFRAQAVDQAHAGFQQPQPSADAGARGGSTWGAPPAGNAPAAPAAPIGDGLAVAPQMRLSSPEKMAEYLPAPGAERYRALLDAKRDAWLLGQNGSAEIDELRSDIQRHQSLTQRMLDDSKATRIDDEPAKAALAEKVAKIKADIDRIEARRAPHVEKMQVIGQALNGVDKYLNYAPISEMRPAADIRIAKADTVAIVADRIAAIRNEVFDTVSRPWPSSDAKARATAEIDYLAGKGRIEVGQSIAFRGQLAWPHIEDVTLRGFGRGMGDMYDVRQVAGSTAIMAWLFRDQIVAKLHAEIDAGANDTIALDGEQRGAELARLNGRLLAEERVLGAIVWRDAAFHLIPADLDPRALLGLDGPAPREDW